MEMAKTYMEERLESQKKIGVGLELPGEEADHKLHGKAHWTHN